MRMRIVLASAWVAMLATAGMAAGPASAMVRAGGYGPHRCYVSELAAGFHGGQAGLGNRGFLVTLTDVSGASCRLDGYPGLELRDALATYLQVTPPGSHRHLVLRIPSGAALVYRGELDVTALARHTPYFP